ncbi:GntR family transcriptional regulator [Jannaschia aquimarina]|uniref:YdfH_3 protein n=1 Tax=Jannaschia aquimarina TaxID=935700 RepID=A0A0D1EMF3_9RHOB|nr:GntR family transcriptional regulator [Jannaschia aquimarina]KIT16860.1 putative HTH-type transcriptional regulator YdfH [Jannaschia aquimarina]SNT12867.1 transcriptional regulator, GntR family [Jannaschia aquimarina]
MALTEILNRPTLHEELVERLRALVVDDTLKPGEKIAEAQLCEAFGVSRTPLREALKVLASEGLVVLQANRGARVTEITAEELAEVFPVIAALEQLAGELAAERLDDAAIAAIQARHDEMIAAFRKGDRKSYFEANQDIHGALVEGAANAVLSAQHRTLATRIRRARFMVNLSEARWSEAIEEHERMMELLHARRGSELGQLMKTHMMNKFAAHLRALEEGASADSVIS